MRVCNICGINKPITEYYEHRGGRSSPGYRIKTCKKCHATKSKAWVTANPEKTKQYRRRAKLKDKYGISIEMYDSMFEQQKGVCALCNKPHKRRPLNVDHCHQTGKIRGLLCDKCNMGIGLFDDNPALLEKVKDYLS